MLRLKNRKYSGFLCISKKLYLRTRNSLQKAGNKLSLRYRIDVNDKGNLFPKGIYRGKIGKEFMKHLKKIINSDNIEEYNPNYISLLISKLKEINIEEEKEYINSFHYFNEDLVKEFMFYSAISSYGVEDQVGIGLIKNK